MKKIDLNDWIESGRGGRGASFFHKDDPDYMLKFDNLLTDPSSMEEELWAASVAYSLFKWVIQPVPMTPQYRG